MKFTSLKLNSKHGMMGLSCNLIAVVNMSLLAMNLILYYNSVPSINKMDIKTKTINKIDNDDDDGWNEIHVYYGKREPLPPPNLHEQWQSSQVGQDLMILALTEEYQKILPVKEQRQQFYFIDLAANDATQLSNTYNLEKSNKYNWNGLCIEPNPIYWERLAHRKCTVVAAFVGAKDLQPVQVNLKGNSMGGIVGHEMDNKPESNKVYTEKYTASLRSVFQRYQVPYDIEYLSLDVEGAETMIMKDFPFDTYSFRFMTVERPNAELRSIFQAHGYQFIQDISNFGETFWAHDSVIQKGLEKEKIQSILTSLMPK
jgi:hypothetical protein